MPGDSIREERVRALNRIQPRDGGYVLYWMQASQRATFNHALEYAVLRANELKKPLLVFFGLTDRFPEANERHYAFMLEGLREVAAALARRRIGMVVRHASPEVGVVELSRGACLVVVDRGYLRIQREWRSHAATHVDCPLIQVESDVVVPVETASPKEEYSAATLRPKLTRLRERYLVPLPEVPVSVPSLDMDFDSLDIGDVDGALSQLDIDRGVGAVKGFRGGTGEAEKRLEDFLTDKLDRFAELRNDPNADCLSDMSPYLHFGQISPIDIALRVLASGSPGADAYLEELVVRRELSMNFAFYNPHYDSFEGLPRWARKTLLEHGSDPRQYVYSLEELERAKTHDPYWNAAQDDMRFTGKMHGYMRMYWGKKIVEWCGSPGEAFGRALYLNNKYELDGRDPNGFAGVAWCFGKHDRPWASRPVFGNIRYMSAEGLRRKFDADGYAKRVALPEEPRGR